jgi:hypothetical protein
MTTINNIAQRILDENGYTITGNTPDLPGLTLTILEYKIDDAIDYVNLKAGTAIANLSGSTAGAKSFTYTAGENVPVKQLVNLMLKAYKEKGEQVNMANLSASYLAADPDYAVSKKLLDESLVELKNRVLQAASADLPIAIGNDSL